MTTTDTPTHEQATTDVDGKIPAVEAFAAAIAQTAHQHDAAHGHEEDAPQEPVQAPLPIPRPPFNHRQALIAIAEREEHVERLSFLMESRQKLYKSAKSDWEEAAKELQALIRQLTKEMRAREQAPADEQLELPHSATCAFERDNPGQICMVCHQEREAVRAQQIAEEHASIADALVAETPAAEPFEKGPDEAPMPEPEEPQAPDVVTNTRTEADVEDDHRGIAEEQDDAEA